MSVTFVYIITVELICVLRQVRTGSTSVTLVHSQLSKDLRISSLCMYITGDYERQRQLFVKPDDATDYLLIIVMILH